MAAKKVKGTKIEKVEINTLEDELRNYEFVNLESSILVKYKYNKRSFRFNALRNVTNDPLRTMNEEKYKYWINDKSKRYGNHYSRLDHQMEVEIPERIKELTKMLVVYTMPETTNEREYELHISRNLSYVAKSVIDKYFYDKLPAVDEFLSPTELQYIDLLEAFNMAVAEFCTFYGKPLPGKNKVTKVIKWDNKHLPDFKSQWMTQTDRDFKYRIAKAGITYMSLLGYHLKNMRADGTSRYSKYFTKEHKLDIEATVNKVATGHELYAGEVTAK